MITTELWLPQIYDYHRTIITTELWLPQNYNYHRTIITTELRLSQNYDYHRTIITTELRLPQNYDYHRTMITTFYRHVLMLDNSKTLGVLGELAKWRNVTVSLAMSVCLSVRPSLLMEKNWLSLGGFSWKLIFDDFFSKIRPQNSNYTQVYNSGRYFAWRSMYIFSHIYFRSSCNEKWLRMKL